MKTLQQGRHFGTNSFHGFTLLEVFIVLAVLFVVVAMLLPNFNRRAVRSPRINCVNNLKQVGLAYRTWALDHNDNFPMQTPSTNGGTFEIAEFAPACLHFVVMSNELSTPKILSCPADSRKPPSTNFATLRTRDISYFVGISANPTNPQMFLSGDRNITNLSGVKNGFMDPTTNSMPEWTDSIHKLQGNVGLADGSVQQFTTSRLRHALAHTGDATNRLAMP